MSFNFIQGNIRQFFYMVDPFDTTGKNLIKIDEDDFIRLVNSPYLEREYTSDGPYKNNVMVFFDDDKNILFVRKSCKVNRRGEPVDGFNVEKGFFEDNKKGVRR